jgi:hypothetical protein
MSTKTELQKRIMRRVYLISFARRLFSPILVKWYILLAIFWKGSQFVSVSNVLTNLAGTKVKSLYGFSASAFVHTELIVQVFLLVGGVVLLLMLRDIFKGQVLFVKT